MGFQTNKGFVTMKFRECNGQNDHGDGVIIVFDVTDKVTYDSVDMWYNECIKITNNIIICGNKVDNKNREVTAKNITFHRKHNLKYFEISARSNYNFEKPYLSLLKGILGDDTELVEYEHIEIRVYVGAKLKNIRIS
jgi:GTPase SAR1 family protein